jgi:hypothetical protein
MCSGSMLRAAMLRLEAVAQAAQDVAASMHLDSDLDDAELARHLLVEPPVTTRSRSVRADHRSAPNLALHGTHLLRTGTAKIANGRVGPRHAHGRDPNPIIGL